MRRFVVIAIIVLALVAASASARFWCPEGGLALTESGRALVRLKSRTAVPAPGDVDPRVSLEELVRPGADSERWSSASAGVIEGYVVAVYPAGPECANCFDLTRSDVHVEVALRLNAPRRERVVVEVTPRVADLAAARGADWSAGALRRDLTGRRCRFEGWLMFDANHAGESENTAPGSERNWRATAWELHPVTSIEIVN